MRTNPDSTHVDNIRCVYGTNIAKYGIQFTELSRPSSTLYFFNCLQTCRGVELIETVDECLKFKLKGYVSNANFPIKKPIFLLFINNRLVESMGKGRRYIYQFQYASLSVF